MGVPKLFRFLVDRYPLIRQTGEGGRLRKEGILPEMDGFYLDMNGIIHDCSHGEGVRDVSESEIFKSIFQYVDALVNIVRPKKVLFLAVDGVAPRAKMNQQRSRRFRSSLEALEKPGSFDSNCITPGTLFMSKLDLFLMHVIRTKMNDASLSPWTAPTLEIYYSSHSVPGEGEHKIMDFIRSNQQKGNSPMRHCLYGLDADLTMLGLEIHESSVCLLREDQISRMMKEKRKGKEPKHATTKQGGSSGGGGSRIRSKFDLSRARFDVFYLSLFREYLELEFKPRFPHGAFDLESFVDDYVLLIMLIGNDFVPHLPGLQVSSAPLIFECYLSIRLERGTYLTDPRGRIDYVFLGSILRMLESRLELKFEKEYYEEKLGFDSGSMDIKSMVVGYLETLQWAFLYYGYGLASWSTHYGFHYAPLIPDICCVIENGIEGFGFEHGKPFLPFEQLLAVLPPYSSGFLPGAFKSLMDVDSAIGDFYPKTFSQDLNGKKNAWEAVVKIPFIDEERLLDAIANVSSPLTSEEHQRNRHGSTLVWKVKGRTEEKRKNSFGSGGGGDGLQRMFPKKIVPAFWRFPTLFDERINTGMEVCGSMQMESRSLKCFIHLKDKRLELISKCGCPLDISRFFLNLGRALIWPFGSMAVSIQWTTDLKNYFCKGEHGTVCLPLSSDRMQFLEESLRMGKEKMLDRYCIGIRDPCNLYAVVCTNSSRYMTIPVELLVYNPAAVSPREHQHECMHQTATSVVEEPGDSRCIYFSPTMQNQDHAKLEKLPQLGEDVSVLTDSLKKLLGVRVHNKKN